MKSNIATVAEVRQEIRNIQRKHPEIDVAIAGGSLETMDLESLKKLLADMVEVAGQLSPRETLLHADCHGCLSGDCPHQTANECLMALTEHVFEIHEAGLHVLKQVDALESSITRSGFDIAPCKGCGLPVVCIPDGLPFCEECPGKICF